MHQRPPHDHAVVGRSCLIFYLLSTCRRWAAMVGDSSMIVFSGLHKVFTGLKQSVITNCSPTSRQPVGDNRYKWDLDRTNVVSEITVDEVTPGIILAFTLFI